MASETVHKRRYKPFKILRKSKLEFLDVYNPFMPNDILTSRHFYKIKKIQVIKVTRFREETAHIARADERRRLVEQMGVDYIRNIKDKVQK
jgi:hypothetical protein